MWWKPKHCLNWMSSPYPFMFLSLRFLHASLSLSHSETRRWGRSSSCTSRGEIMLVSSGWVENATFLTLCWDSAHDGWLVWNWASCSLKWVAILGRPKRNRALGMICCLYSYCALGKRLLLKNKQTKSLILSSERKTLIFFFFFFFPP